MGRNHGFFCCFCFLFVCISLLDLGGDLYVSDSLMLVCVDNKLDTIFCIVFITFQYAYIANRIS